MIIFANNMQQEFLNRKENKVLIATSIGSGQTYALYLKCLQLLESQDENYVGFCGGLYYEFKTKFKKYGNIRFSDDSFTVTHKKTHNKVKFVNQENCYGFDTLLVDNLHNLKNKEYLNKVNKLYATSHACDYNFISSIFSFDYVVSGYGICDHLKDSYYNRTIDKLKEPTKSKLLQESI